jgi:23S rRNA (adenine2030-N6)-methyltransferase
MLAYRHAFHAGNHGDVLKHVLLVATLRHLNTKDKPYWVIDTHAGAGGYALDMGYAQHRREFEGGIAKLWMHEDLPPLLADYVARVRDFDAAHRGAGAVSAGGRHPAQYPGSPELIRALLREQDRGRLFELHPTDHEILAAHFSGDRRFRVANADGYDALKAVLPPPPRRALVLMDPPYEIKTDYAHVLEALKEGLRRFAQGSFMVWIPYLERREPTLLVERLCRLPVTDWLLASLVVAEPQEGGFGMTGSHVFMVNPPWTLRAQLERELPVLARLLGTFPGARCHIDGRSA